MKVQMSLGVSNRKEYFHEDNCIVLISSYHRYILHSCFIFGLSDSSNSYANGYTNDCPYWNEDKKILIYFEVTIFEFKLEVEEWVRVVR